MTVEDTLQGIFARCGLFDDAGGASRPAVVQKVDERRAASRCLVVPQLDERKGPKLSPDEHQAIQTKKKRWNYEYQSGCDYRKSG